MADSGEGSEAYTGSEIQNMIQSQLKNMVAEKIMSEQTQKTNLEENATAESDKKKHHKHKKHHHHKHHHEEESDDKTTALAEPAKNATALAEPVQNVTALAEPVKNATSAFAEPAKNATTLAEPAKNATNAFPQKQGPPKAASLMKTTAKEQGAFDAQAQDFDIPIDEVKAITLHVSPTYALDTVESVTLKSFRKVVGYDTFNSILKKDRDEKKDVADHYNVTVSMMVKRVPEAVSAPPLVDPYDGTKTLAQTLDKGFPYDDADNQPDDQAPRWSKGSAAASLAQLVGKLNGENVTKSALVNLVRDVDSPITQALIQLDE